MSNAKPLGAKLEGFPYGPFFTPAVVAFQEAYSNQRTKIDGLLIDECMRRIYGYQGYTRWQPITSDGTQWYRGLRRHFGLVELVILIPDKTDTKREDGTDTKCHIAVFTSAPLPEELLDIFVASVFEEIQMAVKAFVEPPPSPLREKSTSLAHELARPAGIPTNILIIFAYTMAALLVVLAVAGTIGFDTIADYITQMTPRASRGSLAFIAIAIFLIFFLLFRRKKG